MSEIEVKALQHADGTWLVIVNDHCVASSKCKGDMVKLAEEIGWALYVEVVYE